MSKSEIGLIQKCSVSDDHLTLLYMDDRRYESGDQKKLLWAIVDGKPVTKVTSLNAGGTLKQIYLIAASSLSKSNYLERLAKIIQHDHERRPKIYISKAIFNREGRYVNDNPKEIVNAWFDLEYNVIITLNERNAVSIRQFLENLVLPAENQLKQNELKKSP